METSFDFQSKYTKTNFISRRLIQGFFDGIQLALRDLELQTALEIGCAEGFSTERIKTYLPKSCRFSASELETALLKRAQSRNPDVPIVQESVYQLKRENNSQDMVFCMEVLEHLDDPEKALDELCRVSSKWLLVSVPREPIWRGLNMARLKYLKDFGNTPGHIQHWSKSSFLKFLQGYATPAKVFQPLPWTIVLARVKGRE